MSGLPPTPPGSPPPPAFPPPSPPQRRLPGAFTVLVVLLAVSVLASVTLAVRLSDATRQAERDRARIERLEDRLSRQETPRPAPSGTGTAAFSDPVIERIARAVERLRGLQFAEGIEPEVLSPQQLRERIARQFRDEQDRDEIDTSDKVLTALGLLAADDDLYQILLEVSTEQVAGYYDDEEKSLVVAGNTARLSPLDRMLAAHELVHALTDQHFGLSLLDELQEQRKDDEATAYLSLVEGDATLMMFLYREEELTDAEKNELNEQALRQDSPRLDAAPAVVRSALLFPYEHGARFVNALHQRGGARAIDDAYRDPPSSTEQIMHPARYIDRDEPRDVSLPDIRSALGSGWSKIDEGGVGELDVRIIADQFLPAADAAAAADGWDGGRYAAFESSGGVVVAAATEWDSADQAREASDRLTDWLRLRYGGNGRAYRDGTAVAGWESPSGSTEIVRVGTRVLLITGPNRAAVERARSAFPGTS